MGFVPFPRGPGAQVLELGAGFHGLPSQAALAAGARWVRCTERELSALRQLEINVELRWEELG